MTASRTLLRTAADFELAAIVGNFRAGGLADGIARAPVDGNTFLHPVSGTPPVVVHKSVPVSNLKEFVGYARTDEVNSGSWALGIKPE